MRLANLIGLAVAALLSSTVTVVESRTPSANLPTTLAAIASNDNRTPAGQLRDGVLTLALVAGEGTWYPEAREGPGRTVYAFGEDGGRTLQNPGPLLRVPAGTEILVTLRNAIAGADLVVYGLHERPGRVDTMHVPANATRTTRFRVNLPGTYYYWASTSNAAALRDRWGKETQLLGALIVDPPGASANDHVFVIGVEDEAGPVPAERTLNAAL